MLLVIAAAPSNLALNLRATAHSKHSSVSVSALSSSSSKPPPTLFLPPKVFYDEKTGKFQPFESGMMASHGRGHGRAEAKGLKNPDYFLHYDYEPIFNRRELEGRHSLLSMFPGDPDPMAGGHRRNGGGGGGDANGKTVERPNFLNFPEAAMERCVLLLWWLWLWLLFILQSANAKCPMPMPSTSS